MGVNDKDEKLINQNPDQNQNQNFDNQEPGNDNGSPSELEELKKRLEAAEAEKKKLLRELKAYQKKEEEEKKKRLEEEGKIKELLEMKEKELKAKAEENAKLRAKVVAFQQGLKDPDYIDLMILKLGPEASEEEIKEYIENLKKEKPYLFGEASAPSGLGVDSKAPPIGGGPGAKRVWTREEIERLSPEEYLKHEEEILKAMKEGRIK